MTMQCKYFTVCYFENPKYFLTSASDRCTTVLLYFVLLKYELLLHFFNTPVLTKYAAIFRSLKFLFQANMYISAKHPSRFQHPLEFG